MNPSCPTENSICTGGDARKKALELFIKYGGKHHRRIESEMRALGFPTFTRRVFYNRKSRGREIVGRIERFGWAEHPAAANGQPPTANSKPPPDFEAWLRDTAPGMQWDARHQKIIYEALSRITSGENRRLMIMMPPRHGKSELVTIRYAAWRLRQRPETRVIVGSYNQSLANKFSRSIRSVLSESAPPASAGGFLVCGGPHAALSEPPQVCGGREAAPEIPRSAFRDPHSPMFPRARSINTMSEWETAVGGGVKAVGVGAGITGFGGDLVIIDDPIKSRAHAESQNRRDAAWAWFRDDITTRLEPNAAMILIQTRWHEDDIAGRLLRDMDEGGEQWEVVSLPALSVPPASAGGFLTVPALSEPPEVSGGRKSEPSEVSGGRKSEPPEVSGGRKSESPEVSGGRKSEPPEVSGGRKSEPSEVSGGSRSGIRNSQSEIMKKNRTDHRSEDISNENSDTNADLGNVIQTHHLPTTIPHSLEALWPERFSVADLLEKKKNLGSYSFASLYQQQPSPAEGGIFKRAWFTRIVESAPPGLRWCRGYDLAVSTRTTADFTASFRVAKGPDGTFYIADGFRGRVAFPTQRRYILGRMEEEKSTSHGVEAALHGTGIVQDITDRPGFPHVPLKDIKVDADRLTRALAWANHAESGSIALVRGAWIDNFIEELVAFPNGTHDDQIDAVSIAFRMLGEEKGKKGYAW